jgi:glycosyltransferase involved in cell wall biosynthesis
MILGIDASNIRSGGGVTHLVELLRAVNPTDFGFDRVVVWSSQNTLRVLEERPWLIKRSLKVLEANYLSRFLWQRNNLGALARQEGCDLLFVPGGTFVTKFHPVITMSQNLLPFEWRELLRFWLSLTSLRLLMLRWVQSRSFTHAQGIIFLTRYAQDTVQRVTGDILGDTAIVAHGVDERFFISPRPQKSIDGYDKERPFRLVYVSIIDLYKHQWHVAEAVLRLRAEGYPVTLDLIGSANPAALRRLQKTLQKLVPDDRFIRYLGAIPYQELHTYYALADLCVFASSCENLPNILFEGMASGLPIACSDRGPMPEALGDAGIYFDPEKPESIATAIRQLLDNPELRAQKAQAAFGKVRAYSWKRCADETFEFLGAISKKQGGAI